jgi:Uma2 family endonuclease
LKKAELIEGVVFMPPPVSFEWHSEPHSHLAGWLWVYRAHTPGVRGGADGSIRLRGANMPQPDIFLLIDPACGGQARVGEDGYIEGPPELVCEVAATSAGIDLHEKLDLYRQHGVKEYVIWRTFDRKIDYFLLRGGEYVAHAQDSAGRFRSNVFPGLWLDAPALLQDDIAGFLKTTQEGLASPEHAEFVKSLQR